MKKTKFATKIIFLSIQGYAHGGIPYPFNIGIFEHNRLYFLSPYMPAGVAERSPIPANTTLLIVVY